MSARRILLLVGTDHHGFDRAVAWADDWVRDHPGDDVLVQHGRTAAPRHARGREFLPPDALTVEIGAADVVITHGGPGTVCDARTGGHRPIMFPRDPAFGEHVDDHQLRFARWYANRDMVGLALNAATLNQLVEELPPEGTRLVAADRTEEADAVATFAAAVAAPLPERGPALAVDATRVLLLCGERDPGPTEQRLPTRTPTLVVGALDAWPRAGASARCDCGRKVVDCPVWAPAGQQLGGWGSPEFEERAAPALGSGIDDLPTWRRHPGREVRRQVLPYARLHRQVLAAVTEAAGVELVTARCSVGEALALSHDRQLDLRVVDLGLTPRERWTLRHRRVTVATVEELDGLLASWTAAGTVRGSVHDAEAALDLSLGGD